MPGLNVAAIGEVTGMKRGHTHRPHPSPRARPQHLPNYLADSAWKMCGCAHSLVLSLPVSELTPKLLALWSSLCFMFLNKACALELN